MQKHIKEIKPLDARNPFNLGATVLVVGKHGNDIDAMPASWNSPIDYDKLGVVLDSSHYTRKLIEKSGYFMLALPSASIVSETFFLGTHSKNNVKDKIEKSRIKFTEIPGCPIPLPLGCVAWAVCEVLPEEHNQKVYDLFIGKVVKAYVDDRVFNKEEPEFTRELSPLPNYGGSTFYTIGAKLPVPPIK